MQADTQRGGLSPGRRTVGNATVTAAANATPPQGMRLRMQDARGCRLQKRLPKRLLVVTGGRRRGWGARLGSNKVGGRWVGGRSGWGGSNCHSEGGSGYPMHPPPPHPWHRPHMKSHPGPLEVRGCCTGCCWLGSNLHNRHWMGNRRGEGGRAPGVCASAPVQVGEPCMGGPARAAAEVGGTPAQGGARTLCPSGRIQYIANVRKTLV